MNIGLMIIIGIVFFLIVIVVYIISIYNNIVKEKNKCENAWSQIKVQLMRRYDLIPNLVETVKGYMKHERETLERVIQARNIASNTLNSNQINETIKNDNILTGALKSLFMVFERYPDIKANQNAMALQEEITSSENKIAFARQHYNDNVMFYNTFIQTFPQNIIANFFNFQKFEFFDLETSEAAKRPEIKF